MCKRTRKKWLKKNNKYVNDSELWDFDSTIVDWIVPRLKRFKEINCAYPGVPPYDTKEKWDIALDKIIHSFELAGRDVLDDYHEECGEELNVEKFRGFCSQRQADIQEGLEIFARNFNSLWI